MEKGGRGRQVGEEEEITPQWLVAEIKINCTIFTAYTNRLYSLKDSSSHSYTLNFNYKFWAILLWSRTNFSCQMFKWL